jgi:hypothetical protein
VIGGKDHQLVQAISRDTAAPDGPRWFNVKYCPHCKIYTAQDVTYAPDLTLPAVKLSELTRGGGSMPAECHVGPPEAIKRDWEEGKRAAMTSNAEVLDRAIATANANGWKGSVVYPGVYRSPEQLIYSHDFARALWGKEAPNDYCKITGVEMWQFHLQKMVVADDPIAYLGEHI